MRNAINSNLSISRKWTKNLRTAEGCCTVERVIYGPYKFPRQVVVRQACGGARGVLPPAVRTSSRSNPDNTDATSCTPISRAKYSKLLASLKRGATMCAESARCQREIMRNVANEFLSRGGERGEGALPSTGASRPTTCYSSRETGRVAPRTRDMCKLSGRTGCSTNCIQSCIEKYTLAGHLFRLTCIGHVCSAKNRALMKEKS